MKISVDDTEGLAYSPRMNTEKTAVKDDGGKVIGWVHPAKDGSGWYHQMGATWKRNFVGGKKPTKGEAEEQIRTSRKAFLNDLSVLQ